MDPKTASILASTFGILGNVISFLVFLSPMSTFYRIYKRKSTQGFQSIPYSVALFSAMLYLYYAYLKKHALLLVTINSTGCVIEIIYLSIFFVYATGEAKVIATRLVVIFNLGVYGLVVFVTCVFVHTHASRIAVVGWICAVFSVCVFAAPLAIIRKVIRTKSVEFMPFYLSLFLTLCAVTWFVYGFLIKDYYVATPNVLGFTFGVIQMILYAIYRDKKIVVPEEIEPKPDIIKDQLNIDVVGVELREINEVESYNKEHAAIHPVTSTESSDDELVEV